MNTQAGKTKRILMVIALAFGLSALAHPPTAQAGSWFQESTADPVGTGGVWKNATDNIGFSSPHGNFTASSNLCRTCHAIHDGGGSSWRLLKDGSLNETRSAGEWYDAPNGPTGKGSSRDNECMYCHDANNGLSLYRPYSMTATNALVRGEHTCYRPNYFGKRG